MPKPQPVHNRAAAVRSLEQAANRDVAQRHLVNAAARLEDTGRALDRQAAALVRSLASGLEWGAVYAPQVQANAEELVRLLRNQ